MIGHTLGNKESLKKQPVIKIQHQQNRCSNNNGSLMLPYTDNNYCNKQDNKVDDNNK